MAQSTHWVMSSAVSLPNHESMLPAAEGRTRNLLITSRTHPTEQLRPGTIIIRVVQMIKYDQLSVTFVSCE